MIAMGRDGAAVGPPEIPPPAIVLTDLVAPFVHQAVMGAAEQRGVAETRLAPIGPVADVVCIDEACMCAARKRTTPVARLYGDN